MLAEQGVAFVAIENDAQLIAHQRKAGVPLVFGDASRPELLRKLRIEATVVAADIDSIAEVSADAQVILTSAEFVDVIGKTFAEVIVIENYFDTAELTDKLEAALG